jgi:hypothetical protein
MYPSRSGIAPPSGREVDGTLAVKLGALALSISSPSFVPCMIRGKVIAATSTEV